MLLTRLAFIGLLVTNVCFCSMPANSECLAETREFLFELMIRVKYEVSNFKLLLLMMCDSNKND